MVEVKRRGSRRVFCLRQMALKETSVAGVKVNSVLGELPTLGFESEVLGDERPVQRGHPIGDVVAFMDAGLIIGVMGG